MKRISLLWVVSILGIAMLFSISSQVNAAGGFIDSGIELPGVYDSSIAWGDYDNDGDLDFAVCGRTSERLVYINRIYKNNGDGTFTDIEAGLPAGDDGSLAWGDYDNDGDLDLVVSIYHIEGGSYWTTRIYRNNSNDTFTDIGAGLPGACYSSIAWGDYDNDGDLDLALSGYTGWVNYTYITSFTRIYRNNSNDTFTDIGAGLPDVFYSAVAWGDYDNDGDLDIALSGATMDTSGNEGDLARIYRNNGNDIFTNIAGLPGISDGSLAWGDYDNDGDLDLAVGGWPYSKIYRNNGNNTFTDIGAGLPMFVYGGELAWGDYDNDGDLDLAICGRSDNGPMSRIYKNNGNGTFTDINAGIQGVCYSAIAWGDYDNDGDLDLAVCGSPNATADEPYITKIYKNIEADEVGNNNPNTLPFAPTNLTYEPGSAILKWSAGSDAETPVNGLYYNIGVGTTPDSNDIISGVYGSPLLGNYLRPKLSNSQLGVRLKNLPEGTYYWSVQTIDTSLQASEWSEEKTFIVSYNIVISGYVKTSNDIPISDVTITFNPNGGSTVTDSSGYYSKIVPYGWSGRVTPSKSKYTFSPRYRDYLNVTSDVADQNYIGKTFIISSNVVISGYIKTSKGVAVKGVTMTFNPNGGSTKTDSSGYYSKTVPYGWSGRVTPSKSKYTFSPRYRKYSDVTSSFTNQNYKAKKSAKKK